MRVKVVAKDKKTGLNRWYEDVFTDGRICCFVTPHKGLKPLKDVQEIWVTLGDEVSYVCVYDKDTENKEE